MKSRFFFISRRDKENRSKNRDKFHGRAPRRGGIKTSRKIITASLARAIKNDVLPPSCSLTLRSSDSPARYRKSRVSLGAYHFKESSAFVVASGLRQNWRSAPRVRGRDLPPILLCQPSHEIYTSLRRCRTNGKRSH